VRNSAHDGAGKWQSFRFVRLNSWRCWNARSPPFLYQDGDLEWVSSLVPRWLPNREDGIQNTFIDLCARAIGREEVLARIRTLVTEQKRLFPTRSYGDIRSHWSLDELLFDDGGVTRGDTVTHGLWD
jgi:hypothetical protein